MTYGIKKAKMKATLRGGHANQRIPSHVEFYFYFEKKSGGLSNTGAFAGFMQGASSPNEFVLVKMESADKERRLVLGEFGAFSSNTGTRSEDIVEFKIDKVEAGIYKVTPSALPPGEYALYYASGSAAMGAGNTGKLFDFGVDR